MPGADPNIAPSLSRIRQLDEAAINRIAAGEVVERPASAVKELVENAIDAGASRIDVTIADGGKTLIRVADDGCGMSADDLPLALTRHATSKTDGSDLLDIQSFGFRGEALPSLAAVGRLAITSRAEGLEANRITVAAGGPATIKPAALGRGTVVELKDIFYATPARLKFMRSDRAETMEITSTVKRLAMAEPSIGFTLGEGDREIFRAEAEQGDLFGALSRRLARVLGRDFIQNAIRIDAEREGIRLWGFAGLPTYSRGTAAHQHLFVNGRPVRDRVLAGALRAGYSDVMARDRQPVAALFIDCPHQRVDVNVHPAKTEVRFRDPGLVRGLIVSGLRHALAEEGHRSSTTVAEGILGSVRAETDRPRVYQMDRRPLPSASIPGFAEPATLSARVFEPQEWASDTEPGDQESAKLPLGAARAQIHENYIIAQTNDGMVIVDQHAAHERLTFERLKASFENGKVPSQALLIPEVVEVSQDDQQRLLSLADDLAGIGLVIEPFGSGAVAVRETPAILGNLDARALLQDVLDELDDGMESQSLRDRIDAVLSRMSCHGSIRSGRRMRAEEMNALLREMESTPKSGQCNHGRPTYVTLRLADIERLFGRT